MSAATTDSLRALLLRRLWLPLLVLMLLGAIGSYLLARYYAQQVHDRWLWDSAMSLTQVLPEAGTTSGWELAPAVLRMFEWDTVDRIYVEVRTADGTPLFGTASIPTPASVQDARMFYNTRIDGRAVRVVQTPSASNTAQAMMIRVAETLEKRLRLERRLLLASIPLQALLLLLAGLLIRTGIRDAVAAVNRAALRLSETDGDRLLQPLVTHETPRELHPAVDAFNTLIGRMTQAQAQQQRFVANAAHQLRTPLAALTVQLESALREPEGPVRQGALEHVVNGMGRLTHVTRQILMLNRSESAAEGALSKVPLDLASLCREVLEAHADDAIARGIDLGYEGPDHGVLIQGESQLLRELLANLVDNALRYGRQGGMVTVSLQTSPLALQVDDDGDGIPASERERVLERFYRLAHEIEGCGLGLAIVGEIASRHHAVFELGESASGGLSARLRFASGN